MTPGRGGGSRERLEVNGHIFMSQRKTTGPQKGFLQDHVGPKKREDPASQVGPVPSLQWSHPTNPALGRLPGVLFSLGTMQRTKWGCVARRLVISLLRFSWRWERGEGTRGARSRIGNHSGSAR